MYRYNKNLLSGKIWEIEVAEWLTKKGIDVELHTEYDALGNETYQLYVFHDGNNYPHPDMTITRKMDSIKTKYYIEVKSYFSFYENVFGKVDKKLLNPDNKFVSIHEYQFDSYLQLSRWKETDCHIFFCIINDSSWYYQDIETLNNNKILVKNAYSPIEEGLYYFFDKRILKKIRTLS